MKEKFESKQESITSKTDEQPDFFQLLRQQHGNSTTYMRFYFQQDNYPFHLFHIKNLQQMTIQKDNLVEAYLPINRFINNAINDVLIQNKFVYNNSKIMSCILDTGREIIQGKHTKKHLNWFAFLNRPEFSFIKAAYESLNLVDQFVLQFTVLAVSNFILKLGINISKLSCILSQRKYTSKFMSIPTLSIIFLQFQMHVLFINKEISWQDEEGKSQFIRQLPKITYIKISEILNKQELLLMEFGEQALFTSQTIRKVKNMQYLQFYESEENKSGPYQRITGYEHLHTINLGELIPQSSPYGFQLLFLFRTIYFDIIKDFNPDVIIFVEDYENTKHIILPEVRALIIAQMMENITGKVLVMREVGFRWNQETSVLDPLNFDLPQKIPNNEIDIQDINNQQVIKISPKGEFSKIQEQAPNRTHRHLMEGLTTYETSKFLTKIAESVPKMSKQLQLKLDKEQTFKINQAIKIYQKNLQLKRPNEGYLSKVESVLKNDLSYIALALIQRSSFQEIIIKSHQYIYSKLFIFNLINKTLELLTYTGSQTELHKDLQVSAKQLKSMLENMQLETLVYFKNYYDSVFVIPLNMSFQLKVSHQKQPLRYYDEDYVNLYYGKNGQVLVFVVRITPENLEELKTHKFPEVKVLKYRQNTVLLKLCIPDLNQKENYYFDQIFQDQVIFEGHKIENLTFLITENHIYRAFGISNSKKGLQTKQKSSIFRAEFRNLITSHSKISQSTQNQTIKKPTKALKWIQFSTCCPLYDKTQIPLMQKGYGWTIYDQLSKVALFAGGYAPHGENRINKYIHAFWERQGQIRQMGKTSAQIFQGLKNPKAKIALFPFIYGIPFIMGKKCYILNTNGFFECFTNCNKLFLTEMKLSQDPNDLKHGILGQRKLFVNYEDEEHRLKVVTTKEFVVHFMVKSCRMVNIYQNKCILQTLDEGTMIIELIKKQINSLEVVGLKIATDRPDQNGQDFPFLQFRAYDIQEKKQKK